MKRNKIKSILAAGALLFLMAGCQSNGTNSTSETTKKTDPSSEIVTDPESQIVTSTVYSKSLGMDWNYDIYLPKDYDENSDEKYPIIYLLHGIFGNHRNMLERYDSQAILEDAMKTENQNALVVFVDGFNSFYVNQKDGLQMETAIMEDLVPAIEDKYPVDTDRSKHAIGGISMGGYGAARLALKYSNYFSKALLMSPSVWTSESVPENFSSTMHAFTDGNSNWSNTVYDDQFPTNFLNDDSKNVDFYVISSKDDSTVPFADVENFVSVLKDHSVPVEFTQDTGEDHNWAYWEKSAEKGYPWLIKSFK